MRHLIALLAAAVVLVTASPAAAAPPPPNTPNCNWRQIQTQDEGRWEEDEVGFWINKDSFPSTFRLDPDRDGDDDGSPAAYNDERIINRIRSGARTWNLGRDACRINVRPRVQLVYRGTAQSDARNFEDQINTVMFLDPVNGGLLNGHCPDDTEDEDYMVIGCEHTRPGRNEGLAGETDIAFNRRVKWWTGIRPGIPANRWDFYDLWTLAAHEFGHSLDVAHARTGTPDKGQRAQVMYPSFAMRETRRLLGMADFRSVCEAQGCPGVD